MNDVNVFIEWLRQERGQLDKITKEMHRCSRQRSTAARAAFLAVQALSQERTVMMGQLALRDLLLWGLPVC